MKRKPLPDEPPEWTGKCLIVFENGMHIAHACPLRLRPFCAARHLWGRFGMLRVRIWWRMIGFK